MRPKQANRRAQPVASCQVFRRAGQDGRRKRRPGSAPMRASDTFPLRRGCHDGQNLSLGDMVFTVALLGFVATFKIEGDEVWRPEL